MVIANLTVDGEVKGPHAFLMDLRVDGSLVDGVSVGDMGVKTTGVCVCVVVWVIVCVCVFKCVRYGVLVCAGARVGNFVCV